VISVKIFEPFKMKAKTKSFQLCSVVEDNFGKKPNFTNEKPRQKNERLVIMCIGI
jgi:hypothetical protein